MRGKSVDTEFVASFVQECAAKNKLSPEEICEEAIARIEEIDKQLKLRLKLADVLSFFKYKKKLITEKEIISFNDLNRDLSNSIISKIEECKNNEVDIISFLKTDDNHKDFICTYKQLLQTKVIRRVPVAGSSGLIFTGENYEFFRKSQTE